MSQRSSGYKRHAKDLYETPPWATRVLLPHLPPRLKSSAIWEPAAASGKIVRALRTGGYRVYATEIRDRRGIDFLQTKETLLLGIVTNPPYTHAREFLEHALELMRPRRGAVAMLLRSDYDHAKTRRHLFGDCPAWSRRVVLTERIVWFKPKRGEEAKPSDNHAWFIWDWLHQGAPTIAYGPLSGQQTKLPVAA